MINERVVHALLLTSLGAAGTALGGLMVVLQPKMQFKRLGYLQVCASRHGACSISCTCCISCRTIRYMHSVIIESHSWGPVGRRASEPSLCARPAQLRLQATRPCQEDPAPALPPAGSGRRINAVHLHAGPDAGCRRGGGRARARRAGSGTPCSRHSARCRPGCATI
jgi:hypothetical protein